jgi:hypothetical protein
MSSQSIYENKYDESNFFIQDGVKIFTGTTQKSKCIIEKSIKFYQDTRPEKKKMFTELIPSTLTAKGVFSDISFNEEEIIEFMTPPSDGYILRICCNYGVLVNSNPNYTPPPVKTRVSNRGRKPKTKPKSKRKLQGTGKYFSSQITFEIYNPDNNKIYKIKLFRNGGFQVPGIKKPDITDLLKPIHVLRDYLRNEFMDDGIQVQYFISVMRNYICRLVNTDLLIRLNDLETLFKTQKENFSDNQELFDFIDSDNFACTEICKNIVKEYIGSKHNPVGLAEIQNNCERYFGLIIKFYRPVPWKLEKRTTIKILRSGKINFDGGNSEEEIRELYHWLEFMFFRYYSEVIYDPQNIELNSSDNESGESIYDDDLSHGENNAYKPESDETELEQSDEQKK